MSATTLDRSQAAGQVRPGFLAEMFRREPLYAGAALCVLALVPPTLVALALDGRTLHDVAIWAKPLKFAIALAVYAATLAWFAGWLPRGVTASPWHRAFTIAVLGAIAAEMIWIGGAAAFGVASHFNLSPPAMGTIYGLMGLLAVLLTLPTAVYGALILRAPASPLAPAFRLSVGLGLILTFALTILVAGAMAAGTSHLVGGNTSDAEGWPVTGWARDGGDLRVAHFFATHAMHVIPALGWIASRLLPDAAARLVVLAVSALYCGLVAVTFIEARRGLPFPSMLL